MTGEELIEAFVSAVGQNAAELVREDDVLRWINQGRMRVGARTRLTAPLTWGSGQVSVALPVGCSSVVRVEPDSGSVMPEFFVWGAELVFRHPSCVSAGSAVVYYLGHGSDVVQGVESGLEPIAEQACLSYSLFCFFRRIAATRADFRRYVTVTGQSGLDVNDLEDIAAAYRAEFEDALEDLTLSPPSIFGV